MQNWFKNLSPHVFLIIMYHPGKVLEVFSAKDKSVEAVDTSTQAMLEMWDDNLITVLVESQLSGKLKKEDVVLVDYRPMADKPIPKMTVVKVLRGTVGKQMWKVYKDHHKKRNIPQTPVAMSREVKQPYVG